MLDLSWWIKVPLIDQRDTVENGSNWWLRSPEPGNNNNAQVGLSGGGLNNDNVNNNELAVRPDFP